MREVNIKKKRLKTGLEILLGSEENKELVKDKESDKGILVLNIDDISPNVDQPRSTFNEESIKELAKSIKAQGLLMPILVKVDNNKEKKYKIIAGERRWRACKSIGLKDIKAFIYTNKSEKSEALAAIIENVQREDLSILEEARAYEKLIKNYKMTHENIANSTGKSRSYITNLIRILALNPEVKKLLNDGQISFGHARALLNYSDQLILANKIIKNKMNVREVEDFLRHAKGEDKQKSSISTNVNIKDPNITDYEKYLSLKLGYKVEIKNKDGKGYLLVRYKNLEQLDAIVDLFNN